MSKIKYFAYGSNMSTARLRERVPSCVPLSNAKLNGYELRFHKRSRDGSAKCNAFKTGSGTDFVWGVVFDIDEKEKPDLDRVEGLGHGYNDHEVIVTTAAGGELKVRTYLADSEAIEANLPQFDWYKKYVLDGAAEHRLPPAYIKRFIEAVHAVKDSK